MMISMDQWRKMIAERQATTMLMGFLALPEENLRSEASGDQASFSNSQGLWLKRTSMKKIIYQQASKQEEIRETSGRRHKKEKGNRRLSRRRRTARITDNATRLLLEEDADGYPMDWYSPTKEWIPDDPHPRNNNIHTLYFHENDDPDETEEKSLEK
jgi:hypothetical protein